MAEHGDYANDLDEVGVVDSEKDLELLELEEQAEEVGKLSIREYAQLRGMAPQLVHYYVRQGAVKPERCICGRKVIDVKLADEAIKSRQRKKS